MKTLRLHHIGAGLIALIAPARAQTYTFTTIAANQASTSDSTVPVASFWEPTGIAVDPAGNVYVADRDAHVIWRIPPSGAPAIWAGARAVAGDADGPASAARFNRPPGVALEANRAIVTVSSQNNLIHRIALDGQVRAVAGRVTGSPAQKAIASTVFSQPTGIAVGDNGWLYVADLANHVMQIAKAPYEVSVFYGVLSNSGTADGPAGVARFHNPAALAIDASGNLFVADIFNHTIRKIAPDGTVVTIAGYPGVSGQADGVGGHARFSHPQGIAIDSAGILYVVDSGNRAIRRGIPSTAPAPPIIVDRPRSQAVGARSDFSLGVVATGTQPFHYQRSHDRNAIAGADALIAGLVVNGSASCRVLIRATGPGLAQFGVARAVAEPQLELFDRNANMLQTAGAWATQPNADELAGAAELVGAFALAEDSRDAALLATLLPGSWTVRVSGRDNTTGTALIEVYHLP